jgi:hypothetical protein
MTYNGTWQINMVLSADEPILETLRVHRTAEIKPSFFIKQKEGGVFFSSILAIEVPVHKIHFRNCV